MTIEELYTKCSADELIKIFIHKWMIRGFIAWILTALFVRPTLSEFIIILIPLLAYTTWMIRAEWKQYKQWLNSAKRKRG